MTTRPFYVFDLDGTLADLSHRLHYIQGDPKDWRGFFSAVHKDAPIPHVVYLFKMIWSRYEDAEVWSGRSDECRAQTENWCKKHLGCQPLTFMRKAGDHRPDFMIKREFLAASERRPTVIFDDRKQVVDMWRAEGIPCFQVADGDF